MFHFNYPWIIALLPLPYIIKRFLPLKPKKENIPEVLFPSVSRLKEAFSKGFEKVSSRNLFFFTLLSFSWLFFILALMQPENVDQFRQVKNKGYDLMLAVDISASMQAVDFSTASKTISRLDATKEVVGNFVQGRQGDRVGLIIFGEKAYLHVPLTLDTASVSHLLNDTISGMAGNATSIGDAIGLSIKTLRERPEGSRALILLTDGEDNSSRIPPLEAAKLAKQYGIKIYTIGVGKKGLVPYPTGSGGYTMVNVSMDENLLKEIASITGGQYFLATNKKALTSIYTKIDTLEKTESNETVFLSREPLYYYPLAISAILLLILSLYKLLSRRKVSYGT